MDFIVEVKTKYAHLSEKDVKAIVDRAKMFYYGTMYPCKPDISEEEPITTFFGRQWILLACDEIIERLGFNSAIGYKENGVSWSFDNAQISNRLISMLTPVVGVID